MAADNKGYIDTIRESEEIRNGALTAQDSADVKVAKQRVEQAGARKEKELAAQTSYNQEIEGIAQTNIDKIKGDYSTAKEDNETATKREKNLMMWGGIAEVLANMANMIGVGSFNAVNQPIKSNMADWMKKADENRKTRKREMDNLLERQRAAEAHLAQIKAAGAKSLSDLELRLDENIANAESDYTRAMGRYASNAAVRNADSMARIADVEHRLENEDYEKKQDEQARKDKIWMFNEELEAKKEATAAKSGSIPKDAFKITLRKNGDMPEETMVVDYNSLINTIIANRPELKEQFLLYSSDKDKANLAIGLLDKDADLRALVRKSSYFSDYNPDARPESQGYNPGMFLYGGYGGGYRPSPLLPDEEPSSGTLVSSSVPQQANQGSSRLTQIEGEYK